MSNNFVDVLVIGGGAVGLAIAKSFAAEGREVLVVERENTFGSVTSSRNSGVIHAGVYYDQNSLKAKFCAPGNKRIYEYCKKFKIPHFNTGKFIVACSKDEVSELDDIYEKATHNGVVGIEKVTGKYVSQKEPLINCEEALFVPSSGIVDQTSLMRSYLGELELSGSNAYYSQFKKSELKNNIHVSTILNGGNEIKIESSILNNAARLYAEEVAQSIISME
jgi:Predicted dehydrogenase